MPNPVMLTIIKMKQGGGVMCKCAFGECDCIRLSTLEMLSPEATHADPDKIVPDAIVSWIKNKKREKGGAYEKTD